AGNTVAVPGFLLEGQIFRRRVEDAGVGQVLIGIDGRTADVHLVVQVGRRSTPAAADQADDLAAAHFLSGVNLNLGQMRVVGLEAAAVIDNHQTTIAAGNHFGLVG